MKSVIITGCSKGIGLDTALAFGRAGYKVFATMRNPAMAEAFKQAIKDEGLNISVSAMDVDSDESVKSCIDAILQQFSSIDVLVNNAGITRDQLMLRMKEDDWDAVIDTNLKGAWNFSKAALRPSQPLVVTDTSGGSLHLSVPHAAIVS